MSAFTLDPKPTFKMDVQIPIPGDDTAKLEITFKYRNRKDFLEFVNKKSEKLSNIELIKEIAVGWGLKDAFNDENIAKLDENYMGAVLAIYRAYLEGISGARQKN